MKPGPHHSCYHLCSQLRWVNKPRRPDRYGCQFISRWPEQLVPPPHCSLTDLSARIQNTPTQAARTQDERQYCLASQISGVAGYGLGFEFWSTAHRKLISLIHTLPFGNVQSCYGRDWVKFYFVLTGESNGYKSWFWSQIGPSSTPSPATYYLTSLSFSLPICKIGLLIRALNSEGRIWYCYKIFGIE